MPFQIGSKHGVRGREIRRLFTSLLSCRFCEYAGTLFLACAENLIPEVCRCDFVFLMKGTGKIGR